MRPPESYLPTICSLTGHTHHTHAHAHTHTCTHAHNDGRGSLFFLLKTLGALESEEQSVTEAAS